MAQALGTKKMTATLALTLPQCTELDTAPPETLVAESSGWSADAATHFGKRTYQSKEGPFALPESLVLGPLSEPERVLVGLL